MTAEDKSRTDPEVIRRLAEFRHEANKNPFPLPRIEGVALAAQSRLDNLIRSMSQEELDQIPDEEDVLAGINENDIFVRTKIIPLISKLLERTQRLVPLTDISSLGYACVSEKDSDFTISLAIEDVDADFFSTLDTPLDMQESWDMAPQRARDGLRAFAGYSRGEVIDRFVNFTQEYI